MSSEDALWFGRIPDRWSWGPLGRYFTERRETVSDQLFAPLSVTKDGIVPQLDTAAKTNDGDNRKRVSKGDFVINSRSDRKGSSGLSLLDGSVSVISTVITPRTSLRPEFVHHLLRSAQFQEEYYRYGTGIVADLWSTRYSQMKKIPIPVPPVDEQRRIAGFLDRETAQIDELIAKQEQLISTLAERLSALRTELFDPSSPKHLGRSGEWRGVRLKHVVRRVDQGVSPEASAELADESSWGVLKSGCVNRGVFNPLEHKRLDADFHVDPRHVVEFGDFIVNRASGSPDLVGSAAVVKKLGFNLVLSDKTFRLRLNGLTSSAYLEHFMQSRPYREQVLAAISGAGGLANNLPLTALKNFAVPLAPSASQAWITETLDNAESAHRSATLSVERAIDLLRERRQALISAAVTGQIDVGGAS